MKTRIGNVWYNEDFVGVITDGENVAVESLDALNDIDLLVFWGGEDIHPALYGETNRYSFCGEKPSDRDRFERLIFEAAKNEIPMLGICRGAQFLCAMNGGKLWQHVDNHGRSHAIALDNGQLIQVTSTHHQMMRPHAGMDIIATAETVLSPDKSNGFGTYHVDTEPEPEIVYCETTSSLMIQGHPEYNSASKEFVHLTRNLIKRYFGV